MANPFDNPTLPTGRVVYVHYGRDLQRSLDRMDERTTILNLCVECDRTVIAGFQNDYLCLWCRFEVETGVKVAPPFDVPGGEFSAVPTTGCDRWGCHINPNTLCCNRCSRRAGVFA